jgi:hypothetical protein
VFHYARKRSDASVASYRRTEPGLKGIQAAVAFDRKASSVITIRRPDLLVHSVTWPTGTFSSIHQRSADAAVHEDRAGVQQPSVGYYDEHRPNECWTSST